MSRAWAVTSYFNPVGYRSKLTAYREFRRRLGVPLLTVEHSHVGQYELGPGDAEILLQIGGGDVMWQKERLLNLAIARLPGDCEYVAWLDCDVVFARSDWMSAAIRVLDNGRLCQLYQSVHHLRRDTPPEAIGPAAVTLSHYSLAYALSVGLLKSVESFAEGNPGKFKRGHAWCARRDLLAAHGLYDRNVVGSGDRLIAFAGVGMAEDVIAYDRMAPRHADDYRRWAAGFHRQVAGVACIEGDIYHLWHGDHARRRYSERKRILREADFDPAVDIARDALGCWRWGSDKPEMHRLVREYFEERQEDGVGEGILA